MERAAANPCRLTKVTEMSLALNTRGAAVSVRRIQCRLSGTRRQRLSCRTMTPLPLALLRGSSLQVAPSGATQFSSYFWAVMVRVRQAMWIVSVCYDKSYRFAVCSSSILSWRTHSHELYRHGVRSATLILRSKHTAALSQPCAALQCYGEDKSACLWEHTICDRL
jgi:hypothetical protein